MIPIRSHLPAFIGLTLILHPTSSQAALAWDGSVDAVSAFSEFNWTQHAGGAPAANTINPGAVIANNATLTGGGIEITAGAGSPSNIGGPFLVGTNNLTVSNGKVLAGTVVSANPLLEAQGSLLTVSNGGEIGTLGIANYNQIVVDGGVIDLLGTSGISFGSPSGTNPLMSIVNGSTVDVQFISAASASDDVAVTLDGGSTLTFNGSDNPLNTLTLDILDEDSRLRLTNEVFDNGSGGGFQPEHASKVTFNGAPLVFGSDPFTPEIGDNALATQINGGLGVEIRVFAAPYQILSFGSPTPIVEAGSIVTLEWNAPLFESYAIDNGVGDVTGDTVNGFGSTTAQVNADTTFTLTATAESGAVVRTAEFTILASPDTDNDGIIDLFETNTGIYVGPTNTGTDPALPDTDDDGYDDGVEDNTGIWSSATATGTSPVDDDSDNDGLLDGDENPDTAHVAGVNAGSDPNDPDSDDDGFLDGEEFNGGFDPTSAASKPAELVTFTYDVSDRLGSNAAFSTDNWTGDDLVNWIAGTAFSDRYARNGNDGLDRITRTNDAGFSYSLPADATELRFEADFRINSNFCEAGLTTAGADTLGFGYDGPNQQFYILDGATRINQTGTTPPPADSRMTIRVVVDVVNQTADLIMDASGAATLVMDDVPVSVTGTTLHAADGLSTKTNSRFTGVYRYGITVVSPLGGVSAYDDWAGGFGLDPESDGAPGEDADDDGKSNLLEFATNDDPTSGTGSGKVVSRVQDVGGSDVLTLTLPVRGTSTPFTGATQQVSSPVDGIVYRIQGSPDLSDWTTTVVSEVVPALDAGLPALDTGWEYRTFRTAGDTSSNLSDFLRAIVGAAP